MATISVLKKIARGRFVCSIDYITVIATFAVVVYAIRYYQVFPADDGAFFLRYAENIVAGQGYHWNPGVVSANGTSAPLWPLLIAAVMMAGLPAYVACLFVSLVLIALSCVLIFETTIRSFGRSGALVLAVAMIGSPWILGPAMGGLETPMTIFLLALAFLVVQSRYANLYVVFSLSALIFIHKIDLTPWAAALALSSVVSKERKAHNFFGPILLAIMIVAIYFLSFHAATGAFFPVSFIRKFSTAAGFSQAPAPTMGHWWFLLFWGVGFGRWLVLVLAVASIPAIYKNNFGLLLFMLIGISGQALAYTILPPSEPFYWYLAPASFALNFMASGVVLYFNSRGMRWSAACIASGALLHTAASAEEARLLYVANGVLAEADRALAGAWVDAHTPKSFRVATAWGNPAWLSHRNVYDFSGLNMEGQFDITYILNKYQPEVIILNPFQTGEKPEMFSGAPDGYKPVKFFSSTLVSGHFDFYVVVLVRKDVEAELIPDAVEYPFPIQ